jgi:hypothetical protein
LPKSKIAVIIYKVCETFGFQAFGFAFIERRPTKRAQMKGEVKGADEIRIR